MTLKVRLLGSPSIRKNGQEILFPFAKINALFYYLLVNKSVSRDEIASMLWPDKSEANAKKNLRNTIYQTNKSLGEEYIISLSNQVLSLNPDLPIDLDIDKIADKNQDLDTLYQGDFLKGFYLKDCESYELWMNKMRTYYEKKFTDQLYITIDQHLDSENMELVEKDIRRLIAIDEFNERNYILLMNYYFQAGLYSKIIEEYLTLTDLFKRELGILPTQEITEIYQQTLKKVHTKNQVETNPLPHYYFSRSEEIALFELSLASYLEEGSPKGIIIEGETGNGKTEFVNRLINMNQQSINFLTIECQATLHKEEAYVWDQWINQLTKYLDFPNKMSSKMLKYHQLVDKYDRISFSLLEQIAEQLLPLLEDEQWVVFIDQFEFIDEKSLNMFYYLILSQQLPIFFVFAGNGQWSYHTQQVLNDLRMQEYLKLIHLNPLNYEETENLAKTILGSNTTLSEKDIRNIYDFSQGNLLATIELLSRFQQGKYEIVLTDKMVESIEKQYSLLTASGMEILETLSYFKSYVPIQILSTLIGLSVIQLKKELVDLFRRNLIEEDKSENSQGVRIKNRRLQEYCYNKQSQAVKQLMHKQIAENLKLQQGLQSDNLQLLAEIAYHYYRASQKSQALSYKLSYLQSILRFQHELFPVYSQDLYQNQIVSMSPEEIHQFFENTRSELAQLSEQSGLDDNYLRLELKFLYIEGRYYIRLGQYDRGIDNILRVIVKAKDVGDSAYLLKAYLQMIYFCIQTNSSEDMIQYVRLALDLAISSNNYEAIGILLRLKGLYYLMIGHYERAQKYIHESITNLTLSRSLTDKYAINIAAAYNYLAEIERINGQYEDALRLQKRALAFGEGKNQMTSLVVFYIDLGIIYFAMGDYELAEEYLLKAAQHSESIHFIWKRPQMLAYLATTYMAMNQDQKANEYLQKCELEVAMADKANDRDIGILNWAKVMILDQLEQSERLSHYDKNILNPLNYYDYKSLTYNHLSPFRDVDELNQIK